MNITFNSIKKSFSKLFKKKGVVQHRRDPQGDWKKLLLFFTILVVLVLAADGYLFYKISLGDIFNQETDSFIKTDTIDRSKLKAVNDFYDAQAAKQYDISLTKPALIDPSL